MHAGRRSSSTELASALVRSFGCPDGSIDVVRNVEVLQRAIPRISSEMDHGLEALNTGTATTGEVIWN